MKKSQIAISSVFFIVLAIASIGLLIMLFGGKLGPFSEDLYCKTTYRFQASVFSYSSSGYLNQKCEELLGVNKISLKGLKENTFFDNSDTVLFEFEYPIKEITSFENLEIPIQITLNAKNTSIDLTISIEEDSKVLFARIYWTSDPPIEIDGTESFEGYIDIKNYIETHKDCNEGKCKVLLSHKIPENSEPSYSETHFIRKLEIFYLAQSMFGKKETRVLIPKEEVEKAELKVAAWFKEKKTLYSEEVLSFSSEKDSKTLFVPVFGNAKIEKAELNLVSEERSGKVDLLFVVDTSLSMTNEWETLCEIIETTIQALKSDGADVDSKIYGLGGTQHQQKACEHETISVEQLTQALPEGTSFIPPGPSPYDSTEEAWGVGLIWLAENYPWRADAKRVIFPVSDSDPTGGGGIEPDPNGIWGLIGEGKFTGNEEKVVKKAIEVCKEKKVIVYPVYGDESIAYIFWAGKKIEIPPEGYNVGSKDCETKYKDTCGKIIEWMRDIAENTGGDVDGYRNTRALSNKVSSVIKTLVENLKVDIPDSGDTFEWKFDGPFDTKETIDLKKEFQEYVDSHEAEVVFVPVDILPGSSGGVKIKRFDLEYSRSVNNVQISIAETPVTNKDFEQGQEEKIEFLELLNAFRNTNKINDGLVISASVGSPGTVVLKNLSIEYHSCLIEKALLSNAVACWKQTSYGKSPVNITCYELVLTKECTSSETVTEETLTSLFHSNGLCDVFGNSDFGCGSEDNFRLSVNDFSRPENLLVEYDSKKRQVVIS